MWITLGIVFCWRIAKALEYSGANKFLFITHSAFSS
jgi:hypothetical protein